MKSKRVTPTKMAVILTALVTAMTISLVPLAWTAGVGTEFGIEDDLTILGTDGNAVDPDVEIKGFTVFGDTQTAYTGAVVGAGNVVINGYLSVSSGAYFVGGSTFTGGAYFTDVSSFSYASKIHVGGGAVGQVLKKASNGAMEWGNDDTGLTGLGNPYYLQMVNSAGTGLVDSLFLQNSGGTNITMVSASSMTILGDGTDGLGVAGAATFEDTVTVKANSQLGDSLSDLHGINRAPEANVALSVDSVGTSGTYTAKFYSGGSLAAWIRKK